MLGTSIGEILFGYGKVLRMHRVIHRASLALVAGPRLYCFRTMGGPKKSQRLY